MRVDIFFSIEELILLNKKIEKGEVRIFDILNRLKNKAEEIDPSIRLRYLLVVDLLSAMYHTSMMGTVGIHMAIKLKIFRMCWNGSEKIYFRELNDCKSPEDYIKWIGENLSSGKLFILKRNGKITNKIL